MMQKNRDSGVFPVTSSILACEALAHVIEEYYPFGAGVSCELLKVGTNHTYLVTWGDRRAILKAYMHGVRSHDEIVGELEIVQQLCEHHAPVAQPFRRKDGTMVLTVNAPEGPRDLAVFAYAEGKVGDFEPEHLTLLGRSLAQIHACGDRFDRTPFRQHLDVRHMVREPIKLIRAALTDDKDISLLSTMAEAIECIVAPLPVEPPIYGLCHGDVGGYNSHVDDEGAMTHFDFDFCGYGWRAYDLAVFLWSRNMICDTRTANRHWKWFVDGYESVRQLTPQEHNAIPYFVLCRSLWLAGFGERTHAPGADRRIHKSVRFMREWFASRCTGRRPSRKGGQEELSPHAGPR